MNSLGYFEDQQIQLPVGSHSIKAVYNGDNSFRAHTAVDVVTITQASTTTTVSATPTAAATGQSVTLTATVATQSNAIANAAQEPTGTVQFFLGGTAFGSPVSVTGGINSNTGFAQAVATDPTTTLANGSDSITAHYSGDTNYTASTATAAVTVTVGAAGINLSPASNASTLAIPAPGAVDAADHPVTGAKTPFTLDRSR